MYGISPFCLSLSLTKSQDSLVRRVSDRSPPTASMEKAGENASKQPASMLSIRKHMSNAKEDIPPKESKVSAEKSYNSGFVSLQAALIPNAGKVKGEDLKSPQILASEKVQKTRAPPKSTSEKVTKPKAVPNSPIEKTTASDLEILRKLNLIAQCQC